MSNTKHTLIPSLAESMVEIGERTYSVHFDHDGEVICVVVHSKGRPYRNIGVDGPAARAAIAKATGSAE